MRALTVEVKGAAAAQPALVRWRRLGPLVAVLVVAMAVRLAVVVFAPSLHFPDENFQLFEQAHRLAFGYGVVPWEFEQGMRSLLVPWLLSGVLQVLGAEAPPQVQLFVQRLVLVVMSLAPVVAAYAWGQRQGRLHALVLATVAAIWFEVVYFAARPLTEAIAGTLLVTALAWALHAEGAPHRRRDWVLVGALLGTCVMLRMHLVIGVALVAPLLCARAGTRARLAPLAAGAAAPLLAFGIADWIAWGAPFHSYVKAVQVNLFQDAASYFGTSPWYAYLSEGSAIWAGAGPVIVLLALAQPRRNALWLAAALGILASHSLIPHKEYRFVFPAFACLVMAAAATSAVWLHAATRSAGGLRRSTAVAAVLATWTMVSLSLAVAPGYAANWSLRRPMIETAYWLHRQGDLCGLMLHGVAWWNTAGYAHLHRDIPMYQAGPYDPLADAQTARAFNYALVDRRGAAAVAPPFTVVSCSGDRDVDVCVARRRGGCEVQPGLEPLTQTRNLGGPPNRAATR